MAEKRKRSNANANVAAKGGPAKQQTSASVKQQNKTKKQKTGPLKKQPKPQSEKTETPAAPIRAGSNWLALKANIQQKGKKFSSGEKKTDLDVQAAKQRIKLDKQTKRKQAKSAEWIDNSQIVAMDCEMVGVGLSGKQSALARCSIVDYNGEVLYDKHVRPAEKITDFRTHVSGIRSYSLKNAITFQQCLKEVGKVMKDKIVVGHALKNDFQALMFAPPKNMIRDTAQYRPYMRRKMTGTKLFPKSLKQLAQEVLGKEIQGGEHDSVEDARAALALYKQEQFAWEKYLRTAKPGSSLAGVAPALPKAKPTPEQASLKKAMRIANDQDTDDEDDEDPVPKARMVIPDSNDLASMEYGE